METKKACRIVYARPFDGYNVDNWPEMINWLSIHIRRLETVFREPLASLSQQLRKRNGEGI
jgi:hypothetical protein